VLWPFGVGRIPRIDAEQMHVNEHNTRRAGGGGAKQVLKCCEAQCKLVSAEVCERCKALSPCRPAFVPGGLPWLDLLRGLRAGDREFSPSREEFCSWRWVLGSQDGPLQQRMWRPRGGLLGPALSNNSLAAATRLSPRDHAALCSASVMSRSGRHFRVTARRSCLSSSRVWRPRNQYPV
jgi:hypothetical protein